jgi:hypothetical protein
MKIFVIIKIIIEIDFAGYINPGMRVKYKVVSQCSIYSAGNFVEV